MTTSSDNRLSIPEETPWTANSMTAALTLAEECGLPVFPCLPSKKPYTEHGFHDASRNIEQIVTWWDKWPDALVGVPTGAATKILVIDVDSNENGVHTHDGRPWYRQHLDDLGGPRVHCTGNGGYQLLYRMPAADVRGKAGQIAPGVDQRANGGYVIWWPAHGFEVFGPELDKLPDLPTWLLEQVRAPRTPAPALSANGGDRIASGERDTRLTSFAGTMRRRGMDSEAIYAALTATNASYCDPPLADRDVRRIADSVARYAPMEARTAPAVRPIAVRQPLDWRALASRTPPTREWAIDHWLGMGYVTLLAGAPGTGKTLLAQTLGASLALGRGYVDSAIAPRRVLMWAGEDDESELWRREQKIAQWLGVPLDALSGLHYVQSYDGEDIELAGLVDQRRLVESPMLGELREQIGDYRADVVVLDSTARVYAGNENDRYQVTRFVSMLNRAARPTNAAVVLLAHPSKAPGSEFSGTTAWEASVRARLYLGRRMPDAATDADETAGDDNVRYLCRRKANYSARDTRLIRYADGVMVPGETAAPGGQDTSPLRARAVVVSAVRKLAAMGEHGNGATQSPRYLPKLAKQYRLLEQCTEREFASAMREMRKDGSLVVATVGQYANRTAREGLVLAPEVHK